MSDLYISKYQMSFTKLTRKLYDENQKFYEKALIYIRLDELQERCAYMVKRNKPTNSGTNISFEVVNSKEEYQEQLEKIISDGEKIGLKFEKIKVKENE